MAVYLVVGEWYIMSIFFISSESKYTKKIETFDHRTNITVLFFLNPKIFVDVDGTLTFNKHGYQLYSMIYLSI